MNGFGLGLSISSGLVESDSPPIPATAVFIYSVQITIYGQTVTIYA